MITVGLFLFVTAPAHVVVWADEASLDEARRALAEWDRRVDDGTLGAFRLAPGYPEVLCDTELPELEVGHCAVALGVCDARSAQRVRDALGRLPDTTPTVLETRASLRRACPRLERERAAAVTSLLSAQEAIAAHRARAHISPCSFARPALLARHGPDALCTSLWGIGCAKYKELLALANVDADPCPFLLEAPEATRPLSLRADALGLDVCHLPDGPAYVFATTADAPPLPVDVLCHYRGLDHARAVGPGVCFEYASGLRCYVPTDAPPYALVDELRLDGAPYSIRRDVICVGGHALRLDAKEGLVRPSAARCR